LDLTRALYDLGIQIGLAFQLEDDWLDFYSENPDFGKIQGGDILRGKKSAVILELCESLSMENRTEFLNNYVINENPALRLQEITILLDQYQVKEKLKQRISEYKLKAHLLLNSLELNPVQKNALENWVQFILDRRH